MLRLTVLRESAGEGATGAAPAKSEATPSPAATPPAPLAPKPPSADEIRAQALAEFGLQGKTPEQVKAALESAQKADEAAKSDAEKAAATKLELERVQSKTNQLEAAIRAYADAELGKLTPEQQTAVKALAKNNPAQIVDAISTLRPTWAAASAQAAVDAAPKAGTGDTAPPAGAAPVPGKPLPAVDAAAKLKALSANPYAAMDFASRNRRALYPDIK